MLTEDQQIFEQIKKAKNILVTFRQNYNGDALASALAIFTFLKKLDKKAKVATANFTENKTYSFLPKIKEVRDDIDTKKKFIISLDIKNTKAEEISYQLENERLDFIITPKEGQFAHEHISSRSAGPSFDLIVVTATPDLESLGKIYEQDTDFFFNTPIINIDHHPRNEEFGQINKVEITAISTTEIIYNLLNNYSPEVIDQEIATYLLTGIITESKSFKVGSLTPQSLNIASHLVAAGAEREKIVQHLYQNRDLNTLKLWGRVLARLKSDLDGKLVWSCLTKTDFEKSGAICDEMEDVIEELIVSIPQAEVIILFWENEDDKICIKVYSTKNIDSLSLVKEFEPTGNKEIASIKSRYSITEAEEKIISHIKQKLEKLPL